MLNNHLTDDEVQQYVLDKETETEVSSHVKQCAACRARVETYQLLFTALGQQAEPAFDFNLSELVLAQIPSQKRRFSRDTVLVYMLAWAVIVLTAVVLYLFRNDLAQLLPDITPILGYLVIPSVVTVMVLLCIDMYKNYQNKMNELDFQ
jgi:anti-sigma factor RsiW